jgi:hypothetical protein
VRLVLAMLISAAIVVGCRSPETSRVRGQGPGADIGNRAPVVKMHEGSNPFWGTPEYIPFEHPPLTPAGQAAQISRP